MLPSSDLRFTHGAAGGQYLAFAAYLGLLALLAAALAAAALRWAARHFPAR